MSLIDIAEYESEFVWAIGLLIGFPLAMVLLGELVQRWRRTGHRLADPFGHIRILVLPALAVYLLMTRIVGLNANELYPRLALTALLLGLIYAALSFLKAVLFVDVGTADWRQKMPRILIDLVRLSLVLMGALFVLSSVWGQNLGQMLTALGVGSIVLGLALQEPLGNVFSGIFLLVERPVQVGDWVEIDGRTGEVTEINWRSVHLVTRMKELIVVPNSVLAKGQFKNFCRPHRELSKAIEIGFSYNDPPNKVKRVLQAVVCQTPGILLDPPPVVQTKGFDDYCITYNMRFDLADYSKQFATCDELLSRIWYAARREQLTIPFPTETHIQVSPEQFEELDKRATTEDLTETLQGLGVSKPDEIAGRLERSVVKSFGHGETIVQQDETLAGLHLIISGEASLKRRDDGGQSELVGRLGPGEFFGERALLARQKSEITVQADGDLELVILDGDLLHTTLESSPRAVREIGNVIQARDRDLGFRRRNGQRAG